MKPEFQEVQKFTQWWLWLIILTTTLIPIYGIYRQTIQGEAFGDHPMPDWGLYLFAALTFIVIALFSMMKLSTHIDDRAIRMQFFPFVKKETPWSEVKSARVVNYGFVGGWGIRLGTPYGTVYNTGGKMGIALELTNGKKYLIGTQKEDELKDFILNLRQK